MELFRWVIYGEVYGQSDLRKSSEYNYAMKSKAPISDFRDEDASVTC